MPKTYLLLPSQLSCLLTLFNKAVGGKNSDVTSCHLPFHSRKGGAFVTGAVCFRSVNDLVCAAKTHSEIASTKGSSSQSALVRFLNLTFFKTM